jgi:hypothetical protein
VGLKLILKFKLRCRFRKRQRQQNWIWKFLFFPGFMLYLEAVIEFVKPEIGETKKAKSLSARVPLQRYESPNYNWKNVGFIEK